MNKIKRTNIPATSAGIYQIQSVKNGKIYIGSAVNIRKRKNSHFHNLKNKKHHSIYLQRHFNKYGKTNLQFSILEFCAKEKLIEREQFYIDTLKPIFNFCKIAGSTLGIIRSEKSKQKMRGENNPNYGKHPSEETRQKMHKVKAGKNHPLFGKHHSKETIQKMCEAQTGKNHPLFGKCHSEETKQKMSKAQAGKNNPNYGKHHLHSEETKLKMKKAQIKRRKKEQEEEM